ncbi:MAG TPA: hypothetical protein VHX88_07215 [Solirubrobacteraceae bacterium]|jgi:hypothetical protein|nr:hypothetical protein [Solirubrobacteraceae bacterium]
MRKLSLLLAPGALLLAGCGGSSHPTFAAPPLPANAPRATPTARTSVAPALSGAAASDYPAQMRRTFTAACKKAASASGGTVLATRYCAATLTCIEQHLSYQEYATTEQDIVAGRKSPDMTELESCAASTRSQVGRRASAPSGSA